VVAALLNSTWIRALASMRSPLAASGFRRFNARVIEDLPLPPGALEDTVLGHAATASRSAGGLAAIDERVAMLFALTIEERHALSDSIAPHRR
jgi:hypothetical protein